MLTCTVTHKQWPLRRPFRIAQQVMNDVPVIFVHLRDQHGHIGRGEAAGVDYDGETPATMTAQIEAIKSALNDNIDAAQLHQLLPRGGARNALDCALWDLRAKQSGISVAQQLSMRQAALPCAYTIGIGSNEELEAQIERAETYPVIKIKVDADNCIERVRHIRQLFRHKTLIVDANQSWSLAQLRHYSDVLWTLDIRLIEQPLAREEDESLRSLHCPIPLAADESCTDSQSLSALKGKYDFVNIKLDKCGGFSEALAMVMRAQELGFGLMIGNMCGSSLAMAPAYFIGQFCRYVDLDGPLLQCEDTVPAIQYRGGCIEAPSTALWG